MLKDNKVNEFYQKRKKAISLLQQIKADMVQAVSLLNLAEDTMYEPNSFLDFAILMSLYYLELHIIERVVTGEKPYSTKIEGFIKRDSWTKVENHTYKCLDKNLSSIVDELDELHNC